MLYKVVVLWNTWDMFDSFLGVVCKWWKKYNRKTKKFVICYTYSGVYVYLVKPNEIHIHYQIKICMLKTLDIHVCLHLFVMSKQPVNAFCALPSHSKMRNYFFLNYITSTLNWNCNFFLIILVITSTLKFELELLFLINFKYILVCLGMG